MTLLSSKYMKQLILNPYYSTVENYSKLVDGSLNEIKSDTNKYKKKILEVCQLGKFLMFFENLFWIEILREEPDFIIASKKDRIGLEHQLIIDEKAKEKEGYFTNLCKHA
jgi:hypothetical protein